MVAHTGSSLDLSSPAPSAPIVSVTSLDLSAPAPSTAASGHAASRHKPLETHALGLPLLGTGERRILSVDAPVVHLTRMQSAAGAITFVPATNPTGALALACAFETTDSREHVVRLGVADALPREGVTIVRTTASGLWINLRQIRRLRRFLIVGLPQTPDRATPGGTLTVTTYGSGRLDLPMKAETTLGAKALLTGYVVEGRLVLRAENDPYSGTLQQVCDVYGYSETSWRDPFTPLS